jgi:hypothetical protein
MKKNQLLLLAFFIGIITHVQAQEETLFDNLQIRGGFGGPIIETALEGSLSNAIGGGGGVLFDRFFIGGYGMGNTQDSRYDLDEGVERLELGHGGLWLGYYTPSSKLLHFYSSLRFGWGSIEQDEEGPIDDSVLVLTPEVGLEVNITSWFRLAPTIGYRYVTGTESDAFYEGSDFSGVFIGTTLRFGASF